MLINFSRDSDNFIIQWLRSLDKIILTLLIFWITLGLIFATTTTLEFVSIKLYNDPKTLIRIKGNLYMKTTKIFNHNPHRDYPFKHNGAIFYINSNDGKTVLENGEEIDSVANRLLLFDSSKPHNSTSCTNAKCRINININYYD